MAGMTMQAHMTSIVADSLHSAVQKVCLKVCFVTKKWNSALLYRLKVFSGLLPSPGEIYHYFDTCNSFLSYRDRV